LPIYEYRCESCGCELERMVPRGTAAPACPSCAALMTKKVSATSFILQGGGWYKDHYGLKADKPGTKDEGAKESTPKADAGSTAPAASTPAAASAPTASAAPAAAPRSGSATP
jgi:putative FmdB family regulatory protein